MRSSGKETEIKLAIRGVAAARRRLRNLGFRLRQGRRFEANVLFDSPARGLHRRGCMLRLRSMRGRHWITFKGPAGRVAHYKVRRELETEVVDARMAQQILSALGFQPVFRYEKYRSVYFSPRKGGEVMVDETPIGAFLELEGNRGWIRRMARTLGATPADFITKDYAALYADWCGERGWPVRHMVFRRTHGFSSKAPGFFLTKEKRKRI